MMAVPSQVTHSRAFVEGLPDYAGHAVCHLHFVTCTDRPKKAQLLT